MSELINNREYRQKQLKEIIRKLHEGTSVDAVREEFAELIKGVSAVEISEMEQSLVAEGMPVSEIQRLCDVHASIFKGSIAEIHQNSPGTESNSRDRVIGMIIEENRKINEWFETGLLPALSAHEAAGSDENREKLVSQLDEFDFLDKHYSMKENRIFPYMEKHGITAPPQVMWGVDDEIREKFKRAKRILIEAESSTDELGKTIRAVINQAREMISKEEDIMIPMIREAFNEEDWKSIAEGESETYDSSAAEAVTGSERIVFDAGSLTPEEANAILNTVPVDMTFVGADNKVKYFTQGKERIFDRPRTIIGREVKNCHPPKSVHVVEQIVEELRSGRKDQEDFWIRMDEMFVHIRYFAVRNAEGEFLGVLEVSQDIQPLRELDGEKRLMSE